MTEMFVASKIFNGFVMRGLHQSIELPGPAAFVAPGQSDPAPNKPKPLLMIAGFAISKVPANIWNEWLAANWNSDMVLNKLVFAHTDQNECVALCWQNARTRSGMEQVSGNRVR